MWARIDSKSLRYGQARHAAARQRATSKGRYTDLIPTAGSWRRKYLASHSQLFNAAVQWGAWLGRSAAKVQVKHQRPHEN